MKKIIIMLLISVMASVSMLGSRAYTVNAATDSEDHGFKIDEELYSVNWQETGKIMVTQTVRSIDSAFDKGVELGYVKISVGFATSKEKMDGKYYQKILLQSKMVPQPVKGKKKGMSQCLDIKVSNGYLMENTKIEPVSSVGSTAYTLSTVAGHGISMGSGLSTEDELSFDFSQKFSSDNSITVSYVQNSLNVTTNEDEKGYATWLYDYVSSNSSAEQNNYLFGSSVQYGTFGWNLDKSLNSVYSVRELKFTATFGGGNQGTNKRYRASGTNSLNLGSISKSITIRK